MLQDVGHETGGEHNGPMPPPKIEDINIVVTGLSYSFLMTFLAELGDKTFIMIMIYVKTMNNLVLFIASSLSLAMMHTLGSLFGGLF